MADEDDRDALLRQRPDDLEQLACFLRGQHGSRLVEDDNVGVPVQRLHDLDALLLPDGDVFDPRVRVDRELERVGDVAHASLRRALVDEDARVCRLVREHDVLGDGHHRNQHEVLVHHADAALDRIVR